MRSYPVAHYDKTVPVSGQLRLTKSGLDFLGNEVPELLTTFMPDGLNFCLPKSTGSNPELCLTETCDDGSPGCQLSMTLEDTKITPQPTDVLEIGLTVGDINDKLSIRYDIPVVGVAECDVKLHKRNASNEAARIPATIPVQFTIDTNSPTKDLKINVGEIEADMDELDFTLSGGWRCTAGNIGKGLIRGIVKDMVTDQLNNMVGGMLDAQLCQTCGAGMPACPNNSTCNQSEGICRYNANQECVSRMLGVEGGLMLGQLLSGYTQSENASVDVMVRAADQFKVDTGLALGLRTGFQPENFERCAPVDPTTRPSFAQIPFSPTITGNVRPGSQTPFMMGFGLHKHALQHLMWSTWASGALCLKIGSETIDMLSTSAFSLFLPSLTQLTDGDRAMYIQLAPQNAPDIVLGANKVRQNGNAAEIEEGLFTLDWKDVDIHMYAFVQERFVRLFTLRSDLELPIAMTPDGSGELRIVLGDIDKALKNIRPTKHALMAESEEKIADLLPTLMGVALPMLGDMLDVSFTLPEMMGYSVVLQQNDITSVDNNTFIALFADLKKSTSPLVASVTGVVQDYKVDVSRVLPSGIVRPVLQLDLVGMGDTLHAHDPAELEFSYRLNNGLWSLYQPTSSLTINDPVLALQGEHLVEVRARLAGAPESTQQVPTRLPVVIDFAEPTLTIERSGSQWTLVGEDAADRAEHLMFRYRLVGEDLAGEWTEWSHAHVVAPELDKMPTNFRIEAEVRDRAGYESQAQYTVHRQELESSFVDDAVTAASSSGCGGCAATGMGGQSGNLVVFMLLGLGLLVRRGLRGTGIQQTLKLKKNHLSLLLLACLLLMFSAACGDGATNSTDAQKCEEACLDGFVCRSGQCVPQACSKQEDCTSGICQNGTCQAACSDNSECADLECGADQVGVCTDGGCECQAYCGGTSCGEGKFCCHESNQCQALPDACAGKVCDKGTAPVVKNAGVGNSATCEITGASCECEPLPPLPMGWHGSYASIASNAGVTAVAAYNQTYRDLMVATLDDSLKPTWYFADGVPANGEVTGALDGPRGGIRDRGNSHVGTHTAIVVDNSSNLHVFYRDITNKALKYARGTSTGSEYSFVTATLDGEDDTGYWNTALLKDDQIHVVYTALTGEGKSQIRTLSFASDTAMDELPETPQVLYNSTAPAEVPSKPGYMQATGLFNQLTKTSDGMLLVFYDHNLKNVAWIENNGTWDMPQFLGIPSGPYVSGAMDSENKLHLAYMDPSSSSLVYWKEGSSTQVIMDGVRDDAAGWVLSDIGEGVVLRLFDGGRVQVIFQDTTRHTLYTATLTGNGWAKSALGETGNPFTGTRGFFGKMLIDSGSSVAVEYVINQQRTPTEAFLMFHNLH